MSNLVATEPIPLATDNDGVIRIGGTRVTLDTIVAAYHEGAAPEEIARQYPSLELGDVYSAIAYYLHHRSEVDSYLQERQQQAAVVRELNESRFDPNGIRAKLLARRGNSNDDHASTSG